MSSRFERAMTVMLTLALFCLVFGGKLAVIDRFGTDLPNWDQWDAEGAQVFLPYLQYRLGFLDFFIPHNKHQVACTQALALGLLLLNGQWDARLECVANAGLHSALALAIFLYGRALLGRRWHGVWFATVAALTALGPLIAILSGVAAVLLIIRLHWFPIPDKEKSPSGPATTTAASATGSVFWQARQRGEMGSCRTMASPQRANALEQVRRMRVEV
jgi:hypothetical protein